MFDFKVGQRLYRVNNDRREGQSWITIEKVGRKWLTMDYGARVDKETLEVDGGQYSSPAKCYLTKCEYTNKIKKDAIWIKVVGRWPYNTPDISLEKMVRIAEILEIDIEEKKDVL